jgi:CHAT domain-containing protein
MASPPPELQRGIYVDGDAFSSLPPLPPSSEDPTDALDRAGLALAGANVRPDGIVTARELAGYDWWGTQLVVLSACETGVGAVPSGEGVYGMRRALVLAGAESQVVSLWNANDAATRELMRAFYGELARGTGRAEALRRAKLRLLRQPKFAHPYYWAAFIPAGSWTPLDPHLLKRAEHDR